MSDDEYRNYAEDEDRARNAADDDYRNAKKRRVPNQVTVYQPMPPGPWAQPQPVVVQAPAPPPPERPRLLKDMSTGKLVSLAALVLATVAPLPDAPAAVAETATNFQNMLLYQKALAEHAKRVQQITTVGAIAAAVL